MDLYFYPFDENEFKKKAAGNFVRTIVFDTSKGQIETCCVRKVSKVSKVSKIWEQTCKNNIETDHRLKKLKGDHYQVYSWVTDSKSNFISLPLVR